MLMPHPATLRRLVEEYESLAAHEGEQSDPQATRRTQDLAYTLCVSTGTRDIRQALEVARRQLAAAQATATAELCGKRVILSPEADSHGSRASGYAALHEQ
ncbi:MULTISPECIES: DUF5133 domain-containing protein [Streptomyces]|uniref:DUF5133 domain-containing protein n=1 Tax=Streptomyces stelliscabiei TaxID=146820 RepID=A0A8I0TNX4_9ACTN|nr:MULTISPECIES: DUF5133 domain-containing protein [Streptomyces]KND43188.1 hypothetical protein IQ64_19530 [Streptomyces stelliscabiei]MBE1594742.1 hypothetical protein [Streptomyces stelliscabiei]MDX2519023.1 DUF5133 domain-containing protein [Streptomyces stelliscabiei]MDX2550878.1 DUF5133 domain-containing protein [Streptomyces stelliscabiei]MDX2616640.1 DUF5133 domain-containing protein [Streptomyces stelliscabiei]